MEFSEDTDYVGDDFDGDVVTLVSNVGGRKDRKFSRNYAWAKHAADRGKIRRIVVKVVANGESYRTVDAFRRAVGTPHPAARSYVHGEPAHAMAIVDEVTKILPGHSKDEERPARGRKPRNESPAEPPVDATSETQEEEKTEE
ncbi:hypothetical protein A5747_13260 [Mycobacterium sp. IS-836]|uniref:hypothetical protein n=1 Tax=Mycobacterium sp. IS-836 TaxID=1834160 RepID=UPI00096CC7B9|nr:hypothetical protein [Mycobacterium sp. IS-836]OMC55358.1 hypothetical protein A5747_13260 [Mycobacterium sp. IS-836]